MSTPSAPTVLIIGAGRLGGALLDGWGIAGTPAPQRLLLRVRTVTAAAQAAADRGAVLNPPDPALHAAEVVVLAMKPFALAEVAQTYAPLLSPDAVIVSLLVGVEAAEVARAFGGRRVARAMPTTAVAIAQGTASLIADDADALAAAHALFDPVATTVDLDSEAQMPAAAAVSGSGPAYLYAFVEALEAAGLAQGLPAQAARTLAQATVTGSAAYLQRSGADPAALRRQVASPGGTTEAALKVLTDAGRGLGPLLREAVDANIVRGAEIAAAAAGDARKP
jgi:pyrroline-5-carboxylate reductase